MMLSTFRTRAPLNDEYQSYYDRYVSLVPEGDIIDTAVEQLECTMRQFLSLSEEASSICHPPYTWTIKQVMGHLIDVERIFADRIHRFGMGDFQALTGMDQDLYVANGDYVSPTLVDLTDEFVYCRKGNLGLLRRLPEVSWGHRGMASGHMVSVRALAWMLVGHVTYHAKIVERRIAFSPLGEHA